jgi:hypothetical protein
VWVCWLRGDFAFAGIEDHDATDKSQICRRVEEVELAAKLIYYGARLLQAARTLPPPVE